ncbi:class I SAM-dependent DNA methyltransferase [Nocardiopsis composta]|uniref:SAM-dependent methyltransferase n=1 Tax=Nocardiopsis composta TaxID=157465 RepID=A0A7W8QM30_9ACTN|nr:class I SAM-dependent methyltransferase [Nocardiopsis composta]MBB5432509.1 SAM-dependent methyltransferase [Nocardiopsis composta]
MTRPAYQEAVRASYNAIAADYDEHFADQLSGKPLDRAVLAGFAELVRGGGPVVDVGCGPGRVTAHLASLGLDVHGVDLSPGMLAVARRLHPELRFEEGSMTALDVPEGGFGAVVAWYSLIHILPEEVPGALAGFHRALAPGGRLLLGFQVGEEPLSFTEAFGHRVELDFHRWMPERMAALAEQAGFAIEARLHRERLPDETAPQAFLIARRTEADG